MHGDNPAAVKVVLQRVIAYGTGTNMPNDSKCMKARRPPVPRLSATRSVCCFKNSELWISQKSLDEN